MRGPLARLYAILDIDTAARHGLAPLQVFDAWVHAGVRLIQLRAKTMASGPLLELADELAARARAVGVTFIVNDRADIAVLCGASGVHVGQDDLSPRDARQLAGATAIVGLSTHSPAQVSAALAAPIDYLAIGPVFGTETKVRPDPVVGIDGLAAAVALARPRGIIPVVAIGGITAETARSAIEAGAASVAVVADLMGSDPAGRARALLRAVE